MKHSYYVIYALLIIFFSGASLVSSQTEELQDAGKDAVGELKVSLFFGTNGDVSQAGEEQHELSAPKLAELKSLKTIKFSKYRLLGEDQQSILRSYINWANPMNDSKEILLSFQPIEKATADELKIDLEFWQSHAKIMKSGPTLKIGKPLFIQGPAWRGGYIVIAVELVSLEIEKSSDPE